MKDKEKIFKLLRESVENPQESLAVEEMISKIERTMPKIEVVDENHQECCGFKFYKNNQGRFVCSVVMHRFIWTYFNGKIPDGYEIHHRDFNHDNNDISNLELLTKDEHKKIHGWNTAPSETIICPICGKRFKSIPSSKRKFCSRECYLETKRKREIRKCLQCGKEFSARIDSNQKFCSADCSCEYRKRHEIKICPICNKSFTAKISLKRIYCSDKCFRKSLLNREKIICPVCGKSFESSPSHKRKYCSRECFNVSKRKK